MKDIPGVHDNGCVTLCYDLDRNIVTDFYGNIIYDIFKIITPSQLNVFKEQGRLKSIIKDRTNSYLVKLTYL